MKARSKHSIRNFLFFALIVSLLGSAVFVTPAQAAGTCYVNDDAGGSNSGTSFANAYTSLQSAITDSCTEIWVAAGTYKPHASDRTVSFVLENGTAIYGGFAGTETARDQRNPATNLTTLSGDLSGNDSGFTNNGENSHHVVVGATGATLDGFTITGGNANGSNPYNSGGGMYNPASNPTVTNVTFSGNSATYGGGMYNLIGSPTVTNVTFSGNLATDAGGGIYNHSSNSTVTNVTFSGNSAINNGGGMYIISASSPAITNVTINGNSAATGGGMYIGFTVSPILKNVIISNSISGGDCVLVSASINGSSSNNLIESIGTSACELINGLSGNITGSNPRLGSLANNGGSTQTFALLPGSPALNTGTNTGCPAADQRGATRPFQTYCDIGAFEYNYSGTYFVKQTAGGAMNCQSWANACELKDALVATPSGVEVWVAAGTHKPHASDRTISFVLKNGVAVYGGFTGTETLRSQRNPATNVTILSGDLSGNDSGFTNNGENSYRVVGGATGATLDGFTVTGGNANGGVYPYYWGGGMYIEGSNPTVTNVTFSGNSANSGGGMYNNNGAPTLMNVTFSDNKADVGGGMYSYSNSPTLTNVTFSNNLATDSGGGMYNQFSNPTLTNVTFSGNEATNGLGGGMYNFLSSPTLNNVIIANSINGDCKNNTSSLNANSFNNLIEDFDACGLFNGSNGNIIGSDPKLGVLANNGGSTQTMTLLPGSPAINTGTNTGCPATDQRGVTRPFASTCDIGSYEANKGILTLRSLGADDGWVLESTETSGKGGTINASATTFNLGDETGDKQYRAILSFDTSSLPDTAVITKVTLKIRKQGLVGSDPFASLGVIRIDIRKPVFGPSPALANSDFQAAAGKSNIGNFANNPVNNWYTKVWATNTFFSHINLTGPTQFRLRFATDDNDNGLADYLKFFSGNASLAARPTFIIEYYVP